jgi:hypothetical protein
MGHQSQANAETGKRPHRSIDPSNGLERFCSPPPFAAVCVYTNNRPSVRPSPRSGTRINERQKENNQEGTKGATNKTLGWSKGSLFYCLTHLFYLSLSLSLSLSLCSPSFFRFVSRFLSFLVKITVFLINQSEIRRNIFYQVLN